MTARRDRCGPDTFAASRPVAKALVRESIHMAHRDGLRKAHVAAQRAVDAVDVNACGTDVLRKLLGVLLMEHLAVREVLVDEREG